MIRSFFYKLLYPYIYSTRLKKKLAVTHTLLFLLPTTVLAFFLAFKVYDIVIDNTLRGQLELSSQTVKATEALLSQITYASNTLTSGPYFNELFDTDEVTASSVVISTPRISNLIHTASAIRDSSLITETRIYYDDEVFPDFSAYNTPSFPLFSPLSKLKMTYGNGSGDNLQGFLLSPKMQADHSIALAYVTPMYFHSVLPPYTKTEQISAYAALYCTITPFDPLLSRRSTLKDKSEVLCSSSGQLISSVGLSQSDIPDFLAAIRAEIKDEGHYSLMTYKNQPVYGACFPVRGTDWYLISTIPKSSITLAGQNVILYFSLIYALISLMAIVLSYRLSASIADRIIQVASQMESVKSGRPVPLKLEHNGDDEIGVLCGNYNYMVEEINHLMDRQEADAQELRLAEFRALQAQINPHFLYNTLDMINWLAQSGKTEEISQAVHALTGFYRMILSKHELFHTIEREVAHVTFYMELQNMRYSDCATFLADVPPELLNQTIPKLTFQPIVENALLHGILMKESKKGVILLTGWREDDDLVFSISDDGAGIPPEKLETILDHPDQQAVGSSSRHIGVYNTHLRLKNLYGPSYGLSYTSTPGNGTDVTLRIPGNWGSGS